MTPGSAPAVRQAVLPVFFALLILRASVGGEGVAEQPPGGQPKEEPSAEHVIRQRFLVAYQTAQTPEKKAETVEMLRGSKEKESLRLIAGMLGNAHEVVRRTACAVMSATPDPDGYFVRPLMGMLTDSAPAVRLAAAETLSHATVKGEAIKALAFALMDLAGSARPATALGDAALAHAYDRALQKLTGEKCAAEDTRGMSNFWMDYWKKNGEGMVAREREAREAKESPPEKPPQEPAR